LPVTGPAVLELAKTLHQIKGRGVDLNGKNARAALEPLTPAPVSAARRCLKAGVFSTMAHPGRRQRHIK
jgi:hypothetical protein